MKAPTILYDNDVERLLDMSKAVETILLCLRANSDGRLIAPPRSSVAFEDQGALVFTISGLLNFEGSRIARDSACIQHFRSLPKLQEVS